MKNETERFTIQMTQAGMTIGSAGFGKLHFTASEALMLLGILKEEEDHLRRIARESSPLPFRISLTSHPDEP